MILLLCFSFAVNIASSSLLLSLYHELDKDQANRTLFSMDSFERVTRSAEILEYVVFFLMTVMI